MIQPTGKRVKPSIELEGWALQIDPSDPKKPYLLWPPFCDDAARLSAKQIASRSAVRVEIVAQLHEYVDDESLDALFGVKLGRGAYETGCMTELMMNARPHKEEAGE